MRFSSLPGRHSSVHPASARAILRRSCFALVLLGCPVSAADRYLRPPDTCPFQGDGTTYDCAANPGEPGAFTSWTSANASLRPGDILWIDGQWTVADRWIQTTNGTADAPIRITSYDGSAPALIAGSLGGLVYLQGDYLEVDHLSLFNDSGTCLIAGENSPVAAHYGRRIHDNYFLQCSNGISTRAVQDVGIYDNVLENIGFVDSNQGHCIYVAQGSASVEVYRNRCTARADVFQSHCLHVYHNEPPGPARDLAFHDNVCNGFTVGAGLYNGSSGILVYGNTFIVRSSFGLRCDYGGSEGAFVNNIVIGSATYGAAVYDANCSLSIHHNVYFGTDRELRFALLDDAGVPRVVSWPEWQTAYDQSSLVADPLLVDAPGGDVHLQPGSPCIDRGDDDFASDADVYGGPRIIGDLVDIGAAEFAPQPVP